MSGLPKGWTWTTISNLVSQSGLFSDGDWVESKDQDPNGDVRLIQLADVGDGIFRDRSNRFLTRERALELNCTFLKAGDILVARMPDPLGRACVFPLAGTEKHVTVVDVAIIRPDNPKISPVFLMNSLNSLSIRRLIEAQQSGTTRKRISRSNLANIQVPLPPLPEQIRIVAKLDELFSDLDAGVASVQKARQQLKVYRQAVLKRAFEGRLVARKEGEEIHNGGAEEAEGIRELPAGWRWERLGSVAQVFVGSTPKRNEPRYWNGTINWVSSGEVAFCQIRATRERITETGLRESSCRLHPAGTVVLAMIGEGKTRGQVAILRVEAANNQNTAAIRPSELVTSEYLYYYLVSTYEKNRSVGSGNNQKALNKERVSNFDIPLPPLSEQQAIVAEIERRFSVADALEATIDQSLKKAEALRQSILQKAFRGELVPQEAGNA